MERKTIKRIEAVYWPLITVGYLIYSFATKTGENHGSCGLLPVYLVPQ